jgi:signal transduction histidine kinase
MLSAFLRSNQDELIALCRAKAAKRQGPAPTMVQSQYGIPLFLEQLTHILELEKSSTDSEDVAGPINHAKTPVPSDVGQAAAKHGNELQERGLTIDQVVHEYGDLCQAVTELAVEKAAPIPAADFHTLNRCLDNAIADAATEFLKQHDRLMLNDADAASTVRIGMFAHEMRNVLHRAMLALEVIRRRNVGLDGATAQVLDRALIGLRDLIERSITEVRLRGGIAPMLRRIDLIEFIAEVQVSAALEASARGSELHVAPVEEGLAVDADRALLSSALTNLLQNAFKFSKQGKHVLLTVSAIRDRVLIEVEDECGGLPAGKIDELFRPFEQRDTDRTGLGLGLSISRRSVDACRGVLRVRDLPGKGCIFTIDLPRQT